MNLTARTTQTITIDALPLLGEGGISAYVTPFINALSDKTSDSHALQLLFRLGYDRKRRSRYETLRTSPLNGGNRLLRTSMLPDRALRLLWEKGLAVSSHATGAADIFIATTDLVPHLHKGIVGWILYDLTPYRLQRFFQSDPDAYLARMKRMAARADFIIAISECTKRDAIELLSFPSERIVVVYPGAPQIPAKEKGLHQSVKRPYVCYIGALSTNKNIDGLLRIYSRCVHEHRIPQDLVLTGKNFLKQQHWDSLLTELKIGDRVHQLGWIDESHRWMVLRNADMVWQFSWYEGFGLPVLEASAAGVAVLTSNRGALPEILQSAAQQIDPDDEAGAAEIAAQACNSAPMRDLWRNHGLMRAGTFNWESTIEKLMNFLHDAGFTK